LIAALVESHRLHQRMRPWLDAAASDEVEAHISWRAASETWHAVRHQPGRNPVQAEAVIDDLLRHFQPVETTSTIYRGALRRCSDKGLAGDALTDAIHLVAAEETRADGFITLYAEHVKPLCTAASPKILPPDPPS